jgi:hypothetical protein
VKHRKESKEEMEENISMYSRKNTGKKERILYN